MKMKTIYFLYAISILESCTVSTNTISSYNPFIDWTYSDTDINESIQNFSTDKAVILQELLEQSDHTYPISTQEKETPSITNRETTEEALIEEQKNKAILVLTNNRSKKTVTYPLPCEARLCKKILNTPMEYTQHLMNKHYKTACKKCPLCTAQIKGGHLKKHFLSCHTFYKKYQCMQCKKSYFYNSKLQKHVSTH